MFQYLFTVNIYEEYNTAYFIFSCSAHMRQALYKSYIFRPSIYISSYQIV